MRQLFLDTETTGFGTLDRICEIAVVEMVDRKLTGRSFHRYVNPLRPSNPDALRVHGLTDEFLAGQPIFSEIMPELSAFIDVEGPHYEIFAHNARFDAGMLLKEDGYYLALKDTMAMAKAQFPKQLVGLDALAKRLGVRQRDGMTHGALMDAEVLAQVYLGLTRGQDELLDADVIYVSREGDKLSADPVHVIMATPEELAAHLAIMGEIGAALT